MRMAFTRYIPNVLFITLFYTSLVLLKVIPPPSWLRDHIQHGFLLFREQPSQLHSVKGQSLRWLADTAIFLCQSTPRAELRQTLTHKIYATPIGGNWSKFAATAQLNRTLSNSVVFMPEASKTPFILPSQNNGYLNSRIDLRRRKRAFDKRWDQANSVLHLRDDALFQPPQINSAVLVDQLYEAVRRNQDSDRDRLARKRRKLGKKKKGGRSKKDN